MRAKQRRQMARRSRFSRRTDPGAPPGTLVPDASKPSGRIRAMAYGPDGFLEKQIERTDEIPGLLEKWPVTWIHMDGLGDVALLRELGRIFHLHNLALEDVVHVHQRAKVESYGDHYFLVGRMPRIEERWQTEQISLFFGQRFVLTFQENPGGDCLDPLRMRLRAGSSRARAAGPDYLVYAILDTVVDHYFPLVEECGERLDELETDVSDAAGRPAHGVISRIHSIKRDLLGIRRIVWPLRDALNSMLRDTTTLIADETRIYLRDIQDHTIQIIDLVESYRDISSGIADVHLASVGQRTSEIMKVLTIMSTIFIPLTFLAGVYGMNFDRTVSPWNMPELGWKWGYVAVMAVMAAIAVGMLGFFYRKGWLGGGRWD